LNKTHISEVASLFVRQTISDNLVTFVVFTDTANNILGSTALYYDDIRGFLIDETQIDPIRGRRLGIMTHYFRRVVPILDSIGSYWTEFLLTSESRVLRRVLISELGMKITGLRPAAYISIDGKIRRSVLVAHGGGQRVQRLLHEGWFSNPEFHPLNAILDNLHVPESDLQLQNPTGADCSPQEISVSCFDLPRIATLRRRGFVPVAVDPNPKEVIMSTARIPQNEDVSFLSTEGLPISDRLAAFLSIPSSARQ
jgi:hypothetical protein